MQAVIIRSEDSFRVEAETETHRFTVDEPVSAGGTDEGPTPYDLLSAALGSCTSMTLHFVARRDHIPLEGVEVSVTNNRIHAKDCADCSTTSGYIHRFDVTIRLRGTFTPEQREKLMATASHCPVYKTLTNEIRIAETFVE